ncbi:hypothetical protein [Iodobacter fluviatilis]|uniref:Uncharacterized protein n=1 Tax=Iodobacter fluviatilis TaxID=537 RepID=A0A377Q7C6_9NEIS|nr:hypothetical protein [Iodobacter fluviatilis]TCU88764.1 hypothetical protein EV682_103348 [Iodobacter fluviatilis]STQ91164.1 Uncharacterised protein [Iodobacter fluviatilis]
MSEDSTEAMASRVKHLRICFIATIFFCVSFSTFANPCEKMIRPVSEKKKTIFAKAINVHLNKQLGPSLNQTLFTDSTDIFEVIHYKQWYIIYISTRITDESYLVYSAAPNKSSRYLTYWAGSAIDGEGPAVEKWLKKDAPGIPPKLASCFAWHITDGRGR